MLPVEHEAGAEGVSNVPFCGGLDLTLGKEEHRLMSVFEALVLMIAFATLVLTIAKMKD